MTLKFLINGVAYEHDAVDPTQTVLNLLRYELGRTGSKEGCAEGDCGACTVLVAELDAQDKLVWRAVNACILFLPMIDGRAVVTVEGLVRDGALNAVQQSLVDLHGSQCGFCTPGFVMSLQGAAIGALGANDASPADVLAGNLCRCTGYGPILAAARANPTVDFDDEKTAAALRGLKRPDALALVWRDPLVGRDRRWFSPRSTGELADLLASYPDARMVAGATDVGLWVTKRHQVLDTVISVAEVPELRTLEEGPDELLIGAAVRYAEAAAVLGRLHPDFAELVRRIGATQVRNSGTIGGNIANGSPIGDMPAPLIALGARLILRHGVSRREVALEDFFLSYGRQDLRPGEFVEAVRTPRPGPDTQIRIVKLSKRFDSDISAVCAAFAITVEDGQVVDARVAFGGMAGVPARARACEKALKSRPWSETTVEAAASALGEDFQPLTDVRGSAAYRSLVAANLLRRFWQESAGVAGPGLLTMEPILG